MFFLKKSGFGWLDKLKGYKPSLLEAFGAFIRTFTAGGISAFVEDKQNMARANPKNVALFKFPLP